MNQDAFLDALRDDPTDEITWLALADWLDEHMAEITEIYLQRAELPGVKAKH